MSQAFSFLFCVVLSLCWCWASFSFWVTLASGFVCFWPAVSWACVGCVVGAVSAALISWDCLICTCSGVAGCLVTVFCALFAAPVCWAPLGSLLRHSVTLASCRTLSFCYFSPGFLPLVFIQAWVWGTAVLVMDPPFFFFFFWGGGCSLSLILVVLAWLLQLFRFVQVTWVSWTFCLGFLSLDFQCFAGSSEWLRLMFQFCLVSSLAVCLSGLFFVSSFFWLWPSKLLGVVLR